MRSCGEQVRGMFRKEWALDTWSSMRTLYAWSRTRELTARDNQCIHVMIIYHHRSRGPFDIEYLPIEGEWFLEGGVLACSRARLTV